MPDIQNQTDLIEESFDPYVKRHLKRNYALNLGYGLFGTTGFRLINAPTFVPKYIMMLSGSNTVVGLLRLVGSLAQLSALFMAVPFAEVPLLRLRVVAMGLCSRFQILLMALLGFFLPRQYSLVGFFICYGLFRFFSGYQNILYNTTMSKLIPATVRGSFVGFRNFLGGITAWFVATQVARFHNIPLFSNSYSWTFLTAFVFTTIGLGFFFFSKEAKTPGDFNTGNKQKFGNLLADLWQMTKDDDSFANYVIARAFSSAAFIAAPYYILFVSEELNMGFEEVAILTGYLFLAQTAATLVWGRVADKLGFKAVFLSGMSFLILAVVLLLLSPLTMLIAKFIFMFLGLGMSGFQMGSANIVLEFGTVRDRARRLAVANIAATLVRGFAPLMGGILSDMIGYKPVFSIGLVFMILSLFLLFQRVEEPRYAK